MNILTLIPARSGSKRVPNKNLKPIEGLPLISWTIQAALHSRNKMDIVVSTDSQEIADIAISCGAEVPFLRPKELACDRSSIIDTIEYTVAELKKIGRHYDHVMLLQPSSPLRTANHIDGALAFFKEKQAKAVISVSPLSIPIEWCMPLNGTLSMDGFILQASNEVQQRSQDLSLYYHLNGAIYMSELMPLLEYRTFYLPCGGVYAYPMDPIDGIDIDTPEDLELASYHMKHHAHTLDDEALA